MSVWSVAWNPHSKPRRALGDISNKKAPLEESDHKDPRGAALGPASVVQKPLVFKVVAEYEYPVRMFCVNVALLNF